MLHVIILISLSLHIRAKQMFNHLFVIMNIFFHLDQKNPNQMHLPYLQTQNNYLFKPVAIFFSFWLGQLNLRMTVNKHINKSRVRKWTAFDLEFLSVKQPTIDYIWTPNAVIVRNTEFIHKNYFKCVRAWFYKTVKFY